MRFGKANFKRAVSTILAASLIFSVTPVSAIDGTGEAEITVTDVPVIGDEIIPAESKTEVVTETTAPEISEIPETSETVTEPLDFIENENDFSMFSPVSADIQLNKVSETDSSISISWSSVYGETFSHYEVYCNGTVVQTGLTDTAYTVTGLAGGNEYGISVYAYDIEGNVIGMSDTEYYYTNWTISGDTALTSDKIVSNLYINSGTLNLNGHTLTVNGNVYFGANWNTSYLNINRGQLYVDGNFNICQTNGNSCYGYLTMTNAEDYVCVNGDFYVYSYYNSNLTNGTLEVKGNFTQRQYGYADNFNPSGNHRVLLSGESLQTVNFARTESRFNILEVRNYSAEGVVFSTPVTMNKYIDNGCNVTFSNGERTGWTLEADETIEGDLNLSTGVLDLNGHKLTITGNLIHSGGTVLVNGGELEVQGDYRVQALNGTSYTNSTGVLNMTNEADTVRAMGQFVMQSTASHSGKLTAGTLEIGGNLTQAGANNYNFCTSGSHTVVLNGTEKQTVSIANYGKDNSRFNNLKITNTSEDGVDFPRTAYVVGNLYNTETKITNGANLVLTGTFADNTWNHDIWLNENRTLNEDLEIGGTLYLNGGTLNLNGHTLTVKGNVYLSNAYLNVNKGKLYADGNFNMSYTNGSGCSGYLTMTNAEDYICISGDLYVASYYNYSSLTNGTIEVKGNFTQKHTSYPNNFVPSGNHKVILSGEGLQTVSFDRTESRFNILEIQNYSDEGVVFKTTATIGELIDNGCNVSFANGERSGWTLDQDETIEGDLNLARGTLDLNGHKLIITGNLIHSGGTALVNGGELEVQGDYRVQALNGTNYTNSTGVLNMTNEADTVRVMGQFVMQSTASHSGKLTAGTLEVGGNLTQAGANSYNFCTSGSHTVVLNGTEKQSISINDNYRDYSRFNNLKITNTSAEGVTFSRMAYVVGNLYNTETKITNSWNIYAPTSMKFADNAWNHDIWICENRTLNEDMEIGGTLYLNGGTLNLNGHTLTVKGNVYLGANSSTTYINVNKGKLYIDGNFNMSYTNGSGSYGYLTMTNAEDYICVNGDLYVASYYNYSSLTNGTIEVKGNFTQKHTSYPNNFVPSGNHKVILSGGKLQKIDFATTQSKFNILEITKPIDTGYVFSRTPLWNELIEGTADTEAPTAPKNLKFVRSNSSSISMTWSASSDNAAVYCYYIYRNGERVGNTTKTEYIDNSLKSHTSYEYYIVTCDTSGNLSEWSNILEASTDVDAFAPTQPANLAAKIQSEGVVRLSWTASSDNGTVVKYNVYRNGTLIGSSNGTAFTDSTAFGGYYEYYVEAVDNEDNVSRASASVFIDNLAPSAPILTLNSVKDDYVSLSWECSDNVGVVKYDLYRNDVKIKSFSANMYIDTAVSLDTNYTYYVVAYDAAGNVSENSNEVTVYTGEDTEEPVVTKITSQKSKYNKTAVITVSVKDNIGVSSVVIQCSSDNKTWIDSTSEKANGRAYATVNVAVDTTVYSDGELYIRAVAEDNSGNISQTSTSPVYKIVVDNTAPDKLDKLNIDTNNNQIELNWDKSAVPDFAHYNLYRSADNVNYTIISDSLTGISYIDMSALIGVTYYYAISVVDAVGNESLLLYSTACILETDSTSPKMLSINPVNGSKISENQAISIFCMDNTEIKDISVYIKPNDSNDWESVYSEEINANSRLVKFNLNTENLSSGKYQLKVILTDKYNNVSSDTIVTYTLEKCELSIPELSVEAGNLSSKLSWSMESEKNISYYKVYRRRLGNFVYVGRTTEKEYVDADLEAKKYTYYVVAVDKFGNSVTSERVDITPLNIDGKAPIADAGTDIVVFENESVIFDGTRSTDNVGIVAYNWDFGDNSSSDLGLSAHTYSEAGNYTATLTVYDAAGNLDKATRKITVLDSSNLAAELCVVSNGNQPLSNVMVYYELPDGTKSTVYTDVNGKTLIKSGECSVTVYLYKKGYSPLKKTINVSKNSLKHTIELKKQDLVVGDIKVKELTLQEMIDRGVDITATENQAVFEASVQVAYAEDIYGNSEINVLIDAKGDIIPGTIKVESDHFEVSYDTESGTASIKPKTRNGSSTSTTTFKPIIGEENELAGIAVLRISQNVTWLKECFDVELSVTNLADKEFPINGAVASLIIPDELSLAKTDVTQNLNISMGNIPGGETKTISWAVMGSKQGEYDVSAKFSGTLMPFETDISALFKSSEKIKVYGSSALEYYQYSRVYTDDGMKINTVFIVTNVSDKSIYNVSANLGDIEELNDVKEMKLIYPDGTIIYVYRDSEVNPKPEFLPALRKSDDYGYLELKPGESVIGTHTVSVSEAAMQSAAKSVNNLKLTPDSNGKLCGSIGTVDVKYYENSVRAIAASLAAKVKNGNIRKTTGGKIDSNVLTVAVDISTGNVYWGLSNRKDGNPTFSGNDNICKFISERIKDVNYRYGYTAEEGVDGRGLINCGEYNAINNAINCGADPENLYVYSVVKKNGDYIQACVNCKTMYKGYVHFIGDDSDPANLAAETFDTYDTYTSQMYSLNAAA